MLHKSYTPPSFVMLVDNITKKPFGTIKEKGKFTIGRASSSKLSDIRLDVADAFLSGQHFVVEFTDRGEMIITDNKSINGTYVLNKSRGEYEKLQDGEEVMLQSGDIIKAGETEVLFQISVAKPAASSKSSNNQTTLINLT